MAATQFGDPAGTDPGWYEASLYHQTETVLLAGGTENDQYITVTDGKPGDQVLFTNNTTPSDIVPSSTSLLVLLTLMVLGVVILFMMMLWELLQLLTPPMLVSFQLGTSSVYFQWAVQRGAATPLVMGTDTVISAATQPTVLPQGNTLSVLSLL